MSSAKSKLEDTGGSAACGSREKRSAGYPSAGHVDDGSNHPAKRRSSYPSRSAYNSPTHSLSMSPVPRKENSPKSVTTPVEIQYRLFMYSSTEPDTLRPVVRLGTFEHVVSPSRPEEQEVDYEVMARD